MTVRPSTNDGTVARLRNELIVTLGISGELRRRLAAARRLGLSFFSLSEDVKRACELRYGLGYRACGVEYSQSPERPDPFESFSVSFRTRCDVRQLRHPAAVDLYRTLLGVESELARMTAHLVTQLGRHFKSAGTIPARGWRSWSCIQMNFSEPAHVDVPFIHEEHEDGHLFTLAWADAPGLEVRTSRGIEDAFREDATIVVLPGEILSLLSGGEIRPVFHRVRAEADVEARIAVLYFVDPDPGQCEPWVATGVTCADIGARVLSNSRRFGVEPFDLVMSAEK